MGANKQLNLLLLNKNYWVLLPISWIQENKELKKTIESAVERAYMHGRKFIAVKVQ